MIQAVFTLVGTVVGAGLALLAPVISSTLTTRTSQRQGQRDLAAQILALFDDGASPANLLTQERNAARRRLYLLALRLDSHTAHDACMRFIACADGSASPPSHYLDTWEEMMNAVAKIYRGDYRKDQ